MSSVLEDAFSCLETATEYEERGNKVEAATKYYEGCYLLRSFLDRLPLSSSRQQERDLIREKVTHYEKKASVLLNDESVTSTSTTRPADPRSPLSKFTFFADDTSVVPMPPPVKVSSPRLTTSTDSVVNTITRTAGQANSRLAAALDFDESGRKQEAIHQYMVAAELYLESIKAAENVGPDVESVVTFLKRRLESALERVERLKNPQRKTVIIERRVQQKRPEAPSLTEEEIAILKRSSLIASGVFLPWSEKDAADLSTQLRNPTVSLFTDSDGLLNLSDLQKKRFHRWARPSEVLALRQMSYQEPTMIKVITPYSIRQSCVTDCSMIASLCICAAFERRFQKRLITSIIYPQNTRGLPVVNPFGKYMVKLWLNGVARQVIVDDMLPVDRLGQLLCSHTSSPGLELWVSIIEKAYMKLCGGYDFPGSNSGVDIFAITGWIPERVFFPKNPAKLKDHETPSERAWERLYSASSYGDCLITVSSSPDISKEQGGEVGLVVGHAYAVLRVLETRDGTRLLQLKNPWARKSWNGRFSSSDTKSWTDQICAEIGYNPVEARKHDDGVFFISWRDILLFFQTLHLSWNPALFANRVTLHGFWPASQGPKMDTFNVGENPQYTLTLSEEAIRKKASVWVLLSRHVDKQEQEGCEVTDYLTTHVHRNKGKTDRIFYAGGKSCVLHGAYTNNPHVLIRYDLTDKADQNLSLVLSQYQKSNDVGYTVSCFSTQPFTLGRPDKDLPFKLELVGEWRATSSGGPPSSSAFGTNPMFALRVPEKGASVQLRCSTMKSYAVNVMLVGVDSYGRRVERLTKEPLLDSGHYRFGFVVAEKKLVPPGNYTIIASTFNAQQTGAFCLQVFSSAGLTVEAIAR